MAYQIPVVKQFVEKHGAEVHIIHWDKNKLSPYIAPVIENVFYYRRFDYSSEQLKRLAIKINPDIIYISGWMDRGYLPVARYYKKKGIPVVTGFDDQWRGNLRQRMASLVFPFLMRKYFTHSWVAGPSQYQFAKNLGFNEREIIFNLLTGNTALFDEGIKHLEHKSKAYPRNFLYVGNFRAIKGTDILVEAFKIYKTKYKGDWELICIGNGDLKYLVENNPGIEVIDFLNQGALVEITKRAGVFILPSRLDQWGVVVHEFASAGMPLILSENVGARSTFLIDNYNGFTFRNNSSESLAKVMYTISKKEDLELIEMGKKSYLLSKKINPEIVASSFLSLLEGRIGH